MNHISDVFTETMQGGGGDVTGCLKWKNSVEGSSLNNEEKEA